MMQKLCALVVMLAPMTVACGPNYQYVREVDASTFARPGCRALLEPVHSEALMVGDDPEAKYVADKGADSAASYARDKVESVAVFNGRLLELQAPLLAPGGAPDNTFVLRPIWTKWEPGYYAAIVNKPGVANFTVDVLTTAGQPIEEITFKGAGLDFSSGGRMRLALKASANVLNSYIKDKWACAKH